MLTFIQRFEFDAVKLKFERNIEVVIQKNRMFFVFCISKFLASKLSFKHYMEHPTHFLKKGPQGVQLEKYLRFVDPHKSYNIFNF